jgi:hypothetical protein
VLPVTASVLALLAYIGGATVPQLVPGSYNIKKVPFLQTESAPPPAPPAGSKWQSMVVDSGCSVSVFDSPDKLAALYPSKTYLQTADKSERIFDKRGTVVLPTMNGTGDYQPLVIKHAICAPGFHNLLSVSDVIDSYPAGQVVFGKKNSYIEIEPGTRVPITRTGMLFYLTPTSAPQSHGHRFEVFMNEEIVPADRPTDVGFPSSSPPVVDMDAAAITIPGTESLVHERLGHLSHWHDVLHESRYMIDGFHCPASGGVQCPVCAISKQRRQDAVRTPAPRVRVVQPNSQVSVDLHGPYAEPGISGALYTAVFVDT